jgi:hypothetical protein
MSLRENLLAAGKSPSPFPTRCESLNGSINPEPRSDIRRCYLAAHAELRNTLHRPCVVELDGSSAVDKLAFYRNYVAQSVPVVMRGMAKKWPAVKSWRSSANLISRLGKDTPITVASTPNGRADAVTRVPITAVRRWVDVGSPGLPSGTPDTTAAAVIPAAHAATVSKYPRLDGKPSVEVFVAPRQLKMPVALFMKQLLSQRMRIGATPLDPLAAQEPALDLFHRPIADCEIVYAQYQNNSLFDEYQPLVADIHDDVQKFGDELFGTPADACNVWIGSDKSETTMHQDWYENLYVVVTGTKVFTLIPPWESPSSTNGNTSRRNILRTTRLARSRRLQLLWTGICRSARRGCDWTRRSRQSTP